MTMLSPTQRTTLATMLGWDAKRTAEALDAWLRLPTGPAGQTRTTAVLVAGRESIESGEEFEQVDVSRPRHGVELGFVQARVARMDPQLLEAREGFDLVAFVADELRVMQALEQANAAAREAAAARLAALREAWADEQAAKAAKATASTNAQQPADEGP
jgi:hypothetical protein